MSYKNKQMASDGATRPHQPNPWEVRKKSIDRMVGEYLEGFKMGKTWHEAVAGKWDLDLIRYVSAVASAQAQMIIHPEGGIGWDGHAIFGPGAQITDDMRKQFFSDCKRQANFDMIDVPMPTSRIAQWKKNAEYDAVHVRKPINSACATLPEQPKDEPKEKTPIDLEIERQIAERPVSIAKGIDAGIGAIA